MITSGIVWRMAAGNLRRQWKQTLLTIFAGAIGAMLIAISVVNYESVQRSGEEWIKAHLGPINWKLTPDGAERDMFSAQGTAALKEFTRHNDDGFRLLPYVSTDAAVWATDVPEASKTVLKNMLLIGFSMEEAVVFDAAGAELWQQGLNDDELIITAETAKLLEVRAGDVISIAVDNGDKRFRIRTVAKQSGLTGYLDSGSYAGTIIGSESTVRELSGQTEGGYRAILAGNTNPFINLHGMFLAQGLTYHVEYLKYDAGQKFKRMNYTLMIGMISAIAVVSSMIFMRQVFIMIGESRQEMYGILRAIGFSKRNIASMFAVEAALLSICSALLGTLVGLWGGYHLSGWFYGSNAAELARMAGSAIKVRPYVSVAAAVEVFAAILLFLIIISLLAARKAGEFGIVAALRGPSEQELAGRGNRRRKSVASSMLAILGLGATCIHLLFAFVFLPELKGENMLLIAVTWLIACFTVLSWFLSALDKLGSPLQKILSYIGIPPVSVMLALKYPRWQRKRNYTAALLFALVTMAITFIVCIMQLILATGSVDRTNQTVFGFGGYASYRSVAEKEKIEAVAGKDPFIREHTRGSVSLEPYMLIMKESSIAQAIVPVTSELIGEHPVRLMSRASMFSDDKEAWEAVLNDTNYIILPHYYGVKEPLSPNFDGLVKAGDKITLPVYESKLRSYTEVWEPVVERTFTIAGFVPNDAYNQLIDFYGATFMNEKVASELRPFGFKWENQIDLGFVFFQMDYKDIKLAQALEDRFAIQGVMTFNVPYLKNSAEQLMNRQLGFGFVGFTVISAFIGLMGLAIIQFRAVRERSKQVGMMRCIGISNKNIYGMFLIEGFIISLTGMLAGWAIGSTGVRIFAENAIKDTRVYDEPLAYHYPMGILLPIIGGLVLASLIINMAPARAALKLKAVEVLKMGNE